MRKMKSFLDQNFRTKKPFLTRNFLFLALQTLHQIVLADDRDSVKTAASDSTDDDYFSIIPPLAATTAFSRCQKAWQESLTMEVGMLVHSLSTAAFRELTD